MFFNVLRQRVVGCCFGVYIRRAHCRCILGSFISIKGNFTRSPRDITMAIYDLGFGLCRVVYGYKMEYSIKTGRCRIGLITIEIRVCRRFLRAFFTGQTRSLHLRFQQRLLGPQRQLFMFYRRVFMVFIRGYNGGLFFT